MTIERKVKYVASDGTEHDSPQEAARHDLEANIAAAVECWQPDIDSVYLENVADTCSRIPEALRDAVNAYFEALEDPTDIECPDPNNMAEIEAWVDQHGRDALERCIAKRHGLKEGEIAPGVRGFEMVVPAGSELPPRSVDVSPLGDPNDPRTWRADLPVDHPNYCKPFGSNTEDV